MVHVEDFLFFPVIVLLAMILIALSFRLLFRFFLVFLVIFALWYGLFWLGFVQSPIQMMKAYQQQIHKKQPFALALLL